MIRELTNAATGELLERFDDPFVDDDLSDDDFGCDAMAGYSPPSRPAPRPTDFRNLIGPQGGVDMSLWRLILRCDPCAYCGAPADHIDHIHPRHRGGRTQIDNLTAACTSCNVRKGTKPVLVFMLGRLV